MSYLLLRKKYPRLSDKLESIQTLANMKLADIDYFKLTKMEQYEKPSNRFIRASEKWLQETIENALAKTEFNIVFTNLNLSNNDVSDTTQFTCLFSASSVLQLSMTSFVAKVEDPVKMAETYNGREYRYSKIRVYAINTKEPFTLIPWFFN